VPALITPTAEETQPPAALFELPAATADARSKYLAQGFFLFLGLVFIIGSAVIIRWSSYAVAQHSLLWQTQLSQAAYADAKAVEAAITARLDPWRRWAKATSIRLTVMQALDGLSPEQMSARRYIETALALAAQRDGLLNPAQTLNNATGTNSAAPVGPGPGALLLATDGRVLSAVGAGYQIEKVIRPQRLEPSGISIYGPCLLYTSPSPRDRTRSRMPSSA